MAEALICENKVVQIEQAAFPVSPDLEWVTTTTAEVGDEFDPTKTGEARFSKPTLPTPTVEQIKLEARRRISASGHDWMAAREIGGGDPMPLSIKNYAAAIRADSAILEVSLPGDFEDDVHWTTAP